MKLEEQRQGEVVVLQPTGVISGDDTERLRQRLVELTETSQDRIVVDLALVPQIDSAALEVLVEAAERLIRSGSSLVLASASELIQEILEITEVDSLFEQRDGLALATGGNS